MLPLLVERSMVGPPAPMTPSRRCLSLMPFAATSNSLRMLA